jgi:hypothetical protein
VAKKRRPNPLKERGPKIKAKVKGKKPPKPRSNPAGDFVDLGGLLFGMLGALFGARPLPPRPRVSKMGREEASDFIALHAQIRGVTGFHVSRDGLERRHAYKRASFRLHPDNKETGNYELFVKLQEAMEVLET